MVVGERWGRMSSAHFRHHSPLPNSVCQRIGILCRYSNRVAEGWEILKQELPVCSSDCMDFTIDCILSLAFIMTTWDFVLKPFHGLTFVRVNLRCRNPLCCKLLCSRPSASVGLVLILFCHFLCGFLASSFAFVGWFVDEEKCHRSSSEVQEVLKPFPLYYIKSNPTCSFLNRRHTEVVLLSTH